MRLCKVFISLKVKGIHPVAKETKAMNREKYKRNILFVTENLRFIAAPERSLRVD